MTAWNITGILVFLVFIVIFWAIINFRGSLSSKVKKRDPFKGTLRLVIVYFAILLLSVSVYFILVEERVETLETNDEDVPWEVFYDSLKSGDFDGGTLKKHSSWQFDYEKDQLDFAATYVRDGSYYLFVDRKDIEIVQVDFYTANPFVYNGVVLDDEIVIPEVSINDDELQVIQRDIIRLDLLKLNDTVPVMKFKESNSYELADGHTTVNMQAIVVTIPENLELNYDGPGRFIEIN